MDGQHREVLVKEEDLGWPTGLALDFVNGNRVYWCDSKENIIESMKPDGTDRKIVISGGQKTDVVWLQTSRQVFYKHLSWKKNKDVNAFLFQISATPTVWMFLRDMCTGQQKTKVKCGRQTSLDEDIKSKSLRSTPG